MDNMNSGNNPEITRIRRTPTSMQKRAGFSLLEILVVMVVLLIGILAVVRLFPGGFLTIQRTQEQTIATQLAGQQLDAMKSLTTLPDNITAGLPDVNGLIHELSNIRPDDLTASTDQDIQDLATANGFTLFPNYLGYFLSDVNRFRYIKGETFPVPISNPNVVDGSNKPLGSLATLQLGPVFNYFNAPGGAGSQYTDSLHVYGAALARTLQSAIASVDRPDPSAIVRSDSEYAIDYANHLIAFFPRVAKSGAIKSRQFQITFDYYDTSANPPSLKSQTGKITVPDVDPATVAAGLLPQPIWQDIFNAQNAAPANAKDVSNIRTESEDVSRAFTLITTDYNNAVTLAFTGATAGPNWSDDPYEYAWFSAQNSTANANAGVLVFNPKGHVSFLANNVSDVQAQAQGQSYANSQAITARVDYLTYDNHILRDQRTVPSGAPYTLKLSIPNTLSNGDLLDDGSTFTGIFIDANGGSGSDVIIYDANTGTEVGEISKGAATGPIKFTLDATVGSITLNTADVEANSLQGKPLRIYYRTQKNWGLQVQKASSVYTATSSPGTLDYKTFYIGNDTIGGATKIYFAPSEAGKTVTISEFYLRTASGIIYAPYKNATFKIQDQPSLFETLPPVGQMYPWIDIKDIYKKADNEHVPQGGAAGDAITGFTAAPTGRAVSYLRGLSFKSRVIWKDRNNFRRIDQDSVLTTDRQ